VEKHAVTTDQLQIDTELRLRKAGIRVYHRLDPEWLKVKGSPYLYINVSVSMKKPESICPTAILVELKQNVRLVRNDALVLAATTWSSGYVTGSSGERLREMREIVGDLVDEFINDYLAENPIDRSKIEPRIEDE